MTRLRISGVIPLLPYMPSRRGKRNFTLKFISKLKVKFTLAQIAKAQRGLRYSFTLPLTSALDGEGCQSPVTLPRERPGTQCIGGWVGPRTGLEECGNSRPHRDWNPGPSSP
jgi:hypothetical protein